MSTAALSLAVGTLLDLQNHALGLVAEIRLALQRVKNTDLRRGLRIVFAAIAFAEAATVTGAKLHAEDGPGPTQPDDDVVFGSSLVAMTLPLSPLRATGPAPVLK